MGTFFIWFFTIQGQGKKLTATQAVTTIQTFIASATAHSNMSANIASWRIALHIFSGCIHRIKSRFCLAVVACFVFTGCTPLDDVLTTRTLDNSGELAYSKPEGTSSQSSVTRIHHFRFIQHMHKICSAKVFISQTRKIKSTIEVVVLIFGCSTIPAGSNLVNTNFSTNSSSGTPYCKPTEIAMAKQFIILRMVAPSLAISINISPNVPSLYSPVRGK